jgi:putative ABC transport system permease protein
MWELSLLDLKWRRRRFAIAIVSTAVVLSLTLLLTGLSASFRNEAERTVDSFDADRWVIPEGLSGPFTATSAFPESVESDIAREPGVTRTGSVVLMRGTLEGDGPVDVNVIGFEPGATGQPPISSGRAPQGPGELATDGSLGVDLGSEVVLAGLTFRTVGETKGLSYNGGVATVHMVVSDAQVLGYGGQPLVTAVVTTGVPRSVPEDMKAMTSDAVRQDLLRPLKNATETIDLVQLLLWSVAALIVGSIMYVSTLERVRDFAVLKATGVTNRSLLVGLAVQAVVLAVLASIAACLLSALIEPRFPMPVEVPGRTFVTLPALAIVVALIASAAGLRRITHTDPSTAFASQ